MTTLFGWPRDAGGAGQLCVIGAPHDGGNGIRRGAAAGPSAIRRASLSHAPPRARGSDRGDLGDGRPSDLAAILGQLRDATEVLHAEALCPLMIGGDHALSFAVVDALQAAGELCLVWFDAHTDFSPWSGGAAHSHKQVLRRLIGLPGVRRVVQIGYRGFTAGDERALGDKATVVTSAAARTLDRDALLALIPDHLPCYLSIDIDVVDPLCAPGTAAPLPDGLAPSRVRELVTALVRHRRVVGVDLVEVSPALDVDDDTSRVAADLLHAIADDWDYQLAMRRPARKEPSAMQPTPIPVYEAGEFKALLEGDPDLLLRQPCVVRGFCDQWPARRQWTSLENLASAFGNLPVTAGAPQFITHKHARMCQVKTDFGTYLKYVADPHSLDRLFPGPWAKGDPQILRELDLPLYCGNLRLAQHGRADVFSQLRPLVPEPIEHVNDDVPYYYQSGNHLWLYVSLAGALTPLHQDNNAVIAYLAQLQGTKQAILYSPEDKPHFHNQTFGYFDPHNPNDAEFPTWRQARPWTARLEPGELLIWGPNWAHHVVTLEQSITVSFDFVNGLNLEAYARSMDWRTELGVFSKTHAELVRSRITDPRVHRALDGGVEEDIGREVMLCVLRAALAGDLPDRSRQVKQRMLGALERTA